MSTNYFLKKYQDLKSWILESLKNSSFVLQPEQETRWLLEHFAPNKELSPYKIKKIKEQATLRAQGKPLAYIIGYVVFDDLKIKCKPPILIPRDDTESWLQDLKEELKNTKNLNILDLCTGSGCIALSLSKLKKSSIEGGDINPEALKLARHNREKLKIKNVKFVKSDLFEKFSKAKFDLIVSNPPYISQKLYANLDPSVKNWEDQLALTDNEDGLFFYKIIIANFSKFIKNTSADHPLLCLEISPELTNRVARLLRKNNLNNFKIIKDLSDKDRAIFVYKN